MRPAGCDDNSSVGCQIRLEQVVEESVTDVTDGKGRFDPIGGVSYAVRKLQPSIQKQGLNRGIFLGLPVFDKRAHIREVGEIKWEERYIFLLESGIDGYSGRVRIVS